MKYFEQFNKYSSYSGNRLFSMVYHYNKASGHSHRNEAKEHEAKIDFDLIKEDINSTILSVITQYESTKNNRAEESFNNKIRTLRTLYTKNRDLENKIKEEYERIKISLFEHSSFYNTYKNKAKERGLNDQSKINQFIIDECMKEIQNSKSYINKLLFLYDLEDGIIDTTCKYGYMDLIHDYLNNRSNAKTFKNLFKYEEDFNAVLAILEDNGIVVKNSNIYHVKNYNDGTESYKAKSMIIVVILDLINKGYLKFHLSNFDIAEALSSFFDFNISEQYFGTIKNKPSLKEKYFRALFFIPYKS